MSENSKIQEVKPPRKIGKNRWPRVIQAFQLGGYVSASESDAYLLLDEGTTEKAAIEGRIAYAERAWGTSTRIIVHAFDAENALAVKRQRNGIAS